ncbi:uncharacterized protein VTP21DRAFT_4710 [Calcarisporiella thermophila]|uniref:uncharacterized protein n=1 Tax=Calcarisporiella thermophila TaxID=911321 RepID=UPI003742B2CA
MMAIQQPSPFNHDLSSYPPASTEATPHCVEHEEKWSEYEDGLLRNAVQKFSGKAWRKIAEYCFPDGRRDKNACMLRWRELSRPKSSVKGPWTAEEDRYLLSLVNELGPEKWVLIASRLGTRTGKQCRERWHNHLDPTIDKSPFTPEEEALVFKLYEQMGSKWAEIARTMACYGVRRSDNQLKNLYNTAMQRRKRHAMNSAASGGEGGGESGARIDKFSALISRSPTHRFEPYFSQRRRISLPNFHSKHSRPPSPDCFVLHQQHPPFSAHDGSLLTPPETPDVASGGSPFSEPHLTPPPSESPSIDALSVLAGVAEWAADKRRQDNLSDSEEAPSSEELHRTRRNPMRIDVICSKTSS